MKKPELLAPAGSLLKLKYAIEYGADAVYIGGESFSLREAAENFSDEEIKEGIEYAHQRGKKVYITANIIPHNKDLDDFEGYIKMVAGFGADAVIISDPGLFDITRKAAPEIDIHISTQANNTNYASANMWYNLGAKRVILARELSLEEIKEIKSHIPRELELECFVHGAMCVSYSGRCLLSNYMTGRDSNLGACAHPCRWKYYLMEEQRPGEFLPVFENDRGTFIFNSKDLCMLKYVPELIESGIQSFKIEGRVKTEYYVSTIIKAYRDAIDAYFDGRTPDDKLFDEILKVSHREYTTGFFFGNPREDGQVYGSSSYIREYDLVGIAEDYDADSKILTFSQRNKFFVGDEIEIMMPKGDFKTIRVCRMTDEDGNEIESCPHPMMKIKINCDFTVPPMSMLRKKRE